MKAIDNKPGAHLRPMDYWWLWLGDTGLVSAGMWFFLAIQYGTYEFLGRTLVMALLPLIPALVLVGGAGSTIFALTKVWIEKRAVARPLARALLVGPAVAVALGLGLLGAGKSSGHRLAYICAGQAPASASQVQVTGYSAFLRSEWLAVFQVGPQEFAALVAAAKLDPVPGLEFSRLLERSSLKGTRPFQNLPAADDLKCFKRTFKAGEEHQRGSIYAAFDPGTATAVVFREYHD